MPFVRLLVKMASVPLAKGIGTGPVGDEPDFLRPINRADDFHLREARLTVHQVRALAERLLHLGDLVIADNEFAERDKWAVRLRRGGRERSTDRSDSFAKWTTCSGGAVTRAEPGADSMLNILDPGVSGGYRKRNCRQENLGIRIGKKSDIFGGIAFRRVRFFQEAVKV
jgi:hypothetical protein